MLPVLILSCTSCTDSTLLSIYLLGGASDSDSIGSSLARGSSSIALATFLSL